MIILKLDCFARELFMNDAGGLSCCQVTELYSTMPRDNTKVRVSITFVLEVPPNSPTMLQLFNIIFKR